MPVTQPVPCVLRLPARVAGILVASALLLPVAVVEAAPVTSTFAVQADARVMEATPATNYGASSALQTDGGAGERVETLLRFSVSGVATVTSARLRLYATNGTVDGPAAALTTGSWSEGAVTWQDRPVATSAFVGDLDAVAAPTWVELDVTGLVTGNGEWNLLLQQTGTDSVVFKSRESSSSPPELVVVHDTGGEPPPPPPPPPPAEPQATTKTLVFEPVADARVHEAMPTKKYGASSRLAADGDAGRHIETLLRFAVQGVEGAEVLSATLRLYSVDTSADGPAVTGVTGSWSELDVTWQTRPVASGSPVDDVGAVQKNAWVEWHVASLVPGDGTVDLLLAQPGTDSAQFVSRESSPKPELVVVVALGPCAAGCDDGNACTADACDEASGCSHTPEDVPCSDGNACTTGDACSAGSCVGGGALACDDGNSCTDDSCAPAAGCVATPNSAACDDGSACTQLESCQAGACVAPDGCDDGDGCTLDSCNAVTGLCQHAPGTTGACATTFQRHFGGTGDEKGHGVAALADGGLALVGRTNSFGAGVEDAYVLRTDDCGGTVWQRTLGGAGFESASAVLATTDGGLLVVGESRTWAGMYVAKLSGSGATQWARSYGRGGYDAAHAAVQLDDGGFVVLGESYVGPPGDGTQHNMVLVRLDALGNPAWTETYGGDLDGDAGFWLIPTRNAAGQQDGVLAAGGTESFGFGNDDVWLFKADLQGQQVFSIAYGKDGDDEANHLAPTPDGGYIVTGFTRGFGATMADVLLLKVDGQGNHEWLRRYGGSQQEEGRTVLPVAGGYLVAGWTESFGLGSSDFFLLRTDLDGKLLWWRNYGGKYSDAGWAMAPMADGGLAMVGYSYSFRTGSTSGTRDVYLVKARPDGEAGCNSVAIDPLGISTAKVTPYRLDFDPIHVSGGIKRSTATVNQTAAGNAKSLCECQ